jgi:hypothetical protein
MSDKSKPNDQFDMSLPKDPDPTPEAQEPAVEMIQVKKSTCVATVRKVDLPLWEKQGFKPVDPT